MHLNKALVGGRRKEARPGLYRGIHDLVIEVLAEISSSSLPCSGFSLFGAFRGLFLGDF
jgi:hypothetical protein